MIERLAYERLAVVLGAVHFERHASVLTMQAGKFRCPVFLFKPTPVSITVPQAFNGGCKLQDCFMVFNGKPFPVRARRHLEFSFVSKRKEACVAGVVPSGSATYSSTGRWYLVRVD
jgi:hypothetical protein